MKQSISLLLFILFSLGSGLQAQTDLEAELTDNPESLVVQDTLPKDKEKNYNLWSVNLNAGTHIAIRPFTEGYGSTTHNYLINPDIYHFDFNVRKMFNTKFGLAWDFSYDKFTAGSQSPDFTNRMYRTTLRGVMNMHRVMNWEEFTETFGMQLHLGAGFSFLEGDNTTTFDHYDNIFSIVGGATGMVRLSDKFMLSVDFTIVSNLTHHLTFDGQSRVSATNESRTGVMYTNTLGLTYYFGKKDKHADWYYEYGDEEPETNNQIMLLENQLAQAQKEQQAVRDTLSSRIDQLANQLEANTVIINNFNSDENGLVLSNAQMKEMINGQYVNVYFDFDKTKITTGSISAINFLIKYLNANPQAKVDIIGFADELGDFDYNIDLSRRRAERVYEMVTRFGIDPSRLNLVYKGEDNSVPKESSLARQLVRRVAFEVYDPNEATSPEQQEDSAVQQESNPNSKTAAPEQPVNPTGTSGKEKDGGASNNSQTKQTGNAQGSKGNRTAATQTQAAEEATLDAANRAQGKEAGRPNAVQTGKPDQQAQREAKARTDNTPGPRDKNTALRLDKNRVDTTFAKTSNRRVEIAPPAKEPKKTATVTVVNLEDYSPSKEGYYLIVNVFEYEKNLRKYQRFLDRKGINNLYVFKSLVNQKFYVSAGYFTTQKEALDYRKNTLNTSIFPDSWVYHLKNNK